ncbi:hypothetical protein [Streptomyces sp. NRRL B-3648]|uniref:hypothetical protein n=1 Tax=Streptomyces sp. NRRL B-3648 TaxID=1519493 RepID=UPI0006ADE20B|nr:hypothetical protein [Streptomyces sp. NRRL B-3648]KOX03562.1 hypothetical protein ADL04_10430 [Streptomyces sp. NRRL B-3648]
MSNTENQTTDVTTMENHAPVPPALQENPAPSTQKPEPPADEQITILENHAPVPPALDLGNK